MRKRVFVIMLLLISVTTLRLRADEGMWIPVLIERYNITLMQERGFRLTAEDIYSINRASMKDAVVMFGGGCTGEFISDKGLIITNHHCGFGSIQNHSTLEHDYLTDGFWASATSDELPNPGLTVTILKYMEDVTSKVLEGVTDDMPADRRDAIINANIAAITAAAVKGTHYYAMVRPFYLGNQYFLLVNEVFRDVRLVGAPPSSIGKFGGDTDNWVWPRHTGDFSLFRVYANKENNPAEYAEDNIPYKPAYHFPVSLKGINEGDFTMVFGYPGRTQQYAPSNHISMLLDVIYPKQVEIRGAKLDVINEAMKNDPLVRIKYASKASGISNAWKKWIGEIQSLNKTDGIDRKKAFEKEFSEWVASDQAGKARYGNLFHDYDEIYGKYRTYYFVNNYTNEVFFSNGAEAVGFSNSFRIAAEMAEKNDPKLADEIKRLKRVAEGFFADYDISVDKKLFVTVMMHYGTNIPAEWQTEEFKILSRKYKGDFEAVANRLFSRSIFCDQKKTEVLLENFDPEKVRKDPFFIMAASAMKMLEGVVRPELAALDSRLAELNRLYMAGQMEYGQSKTFYPDANSTLRLAYGKVAGYDSRDGVYHKHFTTLSGIMEKDNPEIYDYDVPDRLRELYDSKDFGSYAVNGDVPVCFIADNHTTGGNSGSPVLNAEGHLIGVNFDRAWEGVASDIMFNRQQSRNISLDIRYALFIIDKFAGAGYLLDEMTIIR